MLPQTPESEPEFPLRRYLHIARRHKWIIGVTTVAVAGLVLAVSLIQTPIYEAEARLVLQQDTAESMFDPSTGQRNDPARAVATEIEIIEGRSVEELARRRVGRDTRVSASGIGQTDVISVRARDADPDRAALIANAYANAYVSFKRTKAVDSLLSASREVQAQLAEIQKQIDDVDTQIGQQSPAQTVELRARRDSLIQQAGAFSQQFDQLQVRSRLIEGGAQVVTSAEVPTAPAEPRPRRSLAVGLILGLVLGGGLALAREQLDESLRSEDDVELISEGLPVLATVPRVGDWRENAEPEIASISDPTGQAAEAYRSLRTSLQFTALDREIKLVQVTSASSSEGKTTTLSNLAVSLANAGLRVIVVCCDLRRPRIHEFFDRPNHTGFTSVLLGQVSVQDAIQDVGVSRLRLLASGPPPPNPSELLTHPRAGDVLKSLREHADFVLVDSPPTLPVTDAAVLARWVDATLVVAASNRTSTKALQKALMILRQVHAPLVGIVLNGVTRGAGQYGYGGYGGYGTYSSDTYEPYQPTQQRGLKRILGNRPTSRW